MDFEAELRTAVDSQVFGSSEPVQGTTVLELIRQLLSRAGGLIKVSPDQADAIIAAALKIYDERVAPIDIPNIGPIIEQFVDAQLRVLLEAALRRILSQVTN